MALTQEDKDKIDKWFKEHSFEELVEELIKAGYEDDNTNTKSGDHT